MKNPALIVPVIAIFVLLFLKLDEREILERTRVSQEEIVFSPAELEGINYIKNKTPKDAIFLLSVSNYNDYPNFNDEYLWLPALAGRRTFYSGERFASQVGIDVKAKKDSIGNAGAGSTCTLLFDYIHTKRSDYGNFDRIISECKSQVVFENNEIIILRHNN